MAFNWFICNVDGSRSGPFTSAQLRTLSVEGGLLPDDRVWRDGLDKPVRARRLQGLSFPPTTSQASATEVSKPPLTKQGVPPIVAAESPKSATTPTGKELLRSQFANLRRGGALIGSAVGEAKRLMSDAITEANRRIDESEQIVLRDRLVFGRSSKHCDWLIADPCAGKRHFEITIVNGTVQLQDLGTDIGTYVNGGRIGVRASVTVANGDTIAAGSHVYQLNGHVLRTMSRGRHAHLVCIDLCKDVAVGGTEQSLRILHQITLEFLPGQFVVLLGPSGSGKSTLLNALSGRSLATSGDILFNEQPLYTHFAALKKCMAIVPQKDLLHDGLSLEAALAYTADLRLPHDMSRQDKRATIEAAIAQVEMLEKAGARITTYSGGQVKRASLANELLADPSLLFVDEATSGLDENSDREIMQMLRKLADAGKTIICITHNLGNVVDCAHKIVVMTAGGHLAFVGTPDETLAYFEITELGQLYGRLKERLGEEWNAAFAKTQQYADMLATAKKRVSSARKVEVAREVVTPLQRAGAICRDAFTIGRRSLALQLSDKRALLVAGSQPALVAAMIIIVFGAMRGLAQLHYTPYVIFLLGTSSFWFGCNNASKEIVRERAIFDRERNSGLDAIGYLCAKWLLLAGFTTIQSVSLLLAVTIGTGIEGSTVSYTITLCLVGMCGVSLGLAISALSSSADVAATAVPLAIIPQVILAGAIKPVDGLAQLVSAVFAPCYWAFGALSHSFANAFELPIQDPMWSQSSHLLSWALICLFSAAATLVAAIVLLGVKISELAKPAEVEAWLRSKDRIAATRYHANDNDKMGK